jgi:hypothetical protein
MITNPNTIKFINEVVRPLCEKARALNALTGNASDEWFAGINTTVPNTSEEVDDGREAQGVSRLTGQDVNSAMNILIAMKTASNVQIISKPCVRALDVS